MDKILKVRGVPRVLLHRRPDGKVEAILLLQGRTFDCVGKTSRAAIRALGGHLEDLGQDILDLADEVEGVASTTVDGYAVEGGGS